MMKFWSLFIDDSLLPRTGNIVSYDDFVIRDYETRRRASSNNDEKWNKNIFLDVRYLSLYI